MIKSFYNISQLKKYYVAGPGEKFVGENHPWESAAQTSGDPV